METKDRALELKNTVLNERDAYSNKTGATPLTIRSDYYKTLAQTEGEKIEEIKALVSLLQYFNEFENEDFSRLFSYIKMGCLYNSELLKEFENYLYSLDVNRERQHPEERKEAQKRIYIIDFLRDIDGFSLNESLIESQHLIQRHFPWSYAEFLSFYSLEKGVELIKELYRKKVRYNIIYRNRETWLKKFGPLLFNTYVLPLKDFLEEDDRRDLEEFCDQHGVMQIQMQSEILSLFTAFCNSSLSRSPKLYTGSKEDRHSEDEIDKLYKETFYGKEPMTYARTMIPSLSATHRMVRSAKTSPYLAIHVSHTSTSPNFADNLNKISAEFSPTQILENNTAMLPQ